MTGACSRIYVVGSLNVDLVQPVERLPIPGETIPGGGLELFPGGKGANQAVAAARMGGRAAMIGNVGSDELSCVLLESLKAAGVDIGGVHSVEEPTGAATIFILPGGENVIVLSAGANATLTSQLIAERATAFEPGDLLLVQLETPAGGVLDALAEAKKKGLATILDPAPAFPFRVEMLEYADYVTPNETEAAHILGRAKIDAGSDDDVSGAASAILDLGALCVILKLGARGCYLASVEHSQWIPAPRVTPVDTTAAGDTFNGAFACALAEGANELDAAAFANSAASLSVTRRGAQSSIPTREEVDRIG